MTFAPSTPRLIASAPIALLITVALASLMQALVSPEMEPVPMADPRVITFTRILQESEPITRMLPDKPPEVEPLTVPTIGPIGPVDPVDPVGPAGRDVLTRLVGPTGVGPGGLGSSGSITHAPQILFTGLVEYPQAMYPRTGSCDVRFDITPSGATTNIEVASCTSRGFERAAANAVARTVYQPARGELGDPIASVGHVAAIDFRIDE